MGAAGYLATSIPLRLASAGSAVALPILAVQRLDDVALGGALVAASLAPAVVVAPLAGAALDRARSPRTLFIAAGLVTATGFAAGALLGVVPVGIIFALLVLAGAAAPFYFGGLSSFVTDAIEDENRAYAVDALSYTIASVAGPGLVAVVGVQSGYSGAVAMWLMAGAALLGALAALRMTAQPRPATDEGWFGTMGSGARHLGGHARLRLVIIAGALSQLGSGALPIVAISLSRERAGDVHEAALIVTAYAIGGLLGAVFSAARPGSRLAPPVVMAGGWAAIGLFTLLAVPDLGLIWTIAMIGVSGVFTASSNAAMLLLRKVLSPPEVRSQVFTIGSAVRAATGSLGAAVAGAVAGLDAGVLVAGIGVIWLLSAAAMVPWRWSGAERAATAPSATGESGAT